MLSSATDAGSLVVPGRGVLPVAWTGERWTGGPGSHDGAGHISRPAMLILLTPRSLAGGRPDGRPGADRPGRLATRPPRPRARSNPRTRPRRRALRRPWGAAAAWPVAHVLSCTQGSDDSAVRETSNRSSSAHLQRTLAPVRKRQRAVLWA